MRFGSKKSQIAMEFMLLSGIALILAIIFVSLSISQIKDLYTTKEYLLLKDVALKIQNEISIASYAENGYSRSFKLPDKINNRDYNITIVNNSLTVWTDTSLFFVRVINITGSLTNGTNEISKTSDKIRIKKAN
jgi:uncharacterized protein (UPF0333 family)|tara:strand:+ start:88 stop:489 length:402 start_codon:yes stop_codon:yes gene_type:complete